MTVILNDVMITVTPLSCAYHVTKHMGWCFCDGVNVQAIPDAAAGALAPILQSQQQQQAVITTPATPAGQPGHGEDRSVNYKFVGAST